jgi:hypothetical protein
VRRRLVPLALAVTALLAVVALAAHGRPLGSGSGRSSGLSQSFWDYAFTTLLLFEALLAVLAFVGLFLFRRDPDQRPPQRSRTMRALAILILGGAFLAFVGRHIDLQHLLHPNQRTTTTPTLPRSPVTKGKHHRPAPTPAQHVHFQWDELAVVLAVLLVLGVLAAKTGSRRVAPTWRRTPDLLAAALDESLDDLRNDPDLRRAIVAAYARMETALGAAGLPRKPAEAPLEYVERALLSLDTSAAAVRRLTDLFEWARFSQHEPDPSMRDEAVDALVAVRDELHASELVPA